MRLHSDIIGKATILEALAEQKRHGRIMTTVRPWRLTEHKSTVARYAIELSLESTLPGNGRRQGAHGSYANGQGQTWAATHDEWGWLLAALYQEDPDMVVGQPSSPTYERIGHFRHVTGLSYSPGLLKLELERGLGDPYPFVLGKGAMLGRQGFGRIDEDQARYRHWTSRELNAAVERFERGESQFRQYLKYLPRDLAWVERFGRGEIR